MVLRMTSSGNKVRGCPSSTPGWVLKKEKKKETTYICIIYLICNIYCIYLIRILYIYILHIYVESKVCGIEIGLHLQHILVDPSDRWCYR